MTFYVVFKIIEAMNASLTSRKLCKEYKRRGATSPFRLRTDMDTSRDEKSRENQNAFQRNIDFSATVTSLRNVRSQRLKIFRIRCRTSRKFPDLISCDARGTFRGSYVRTDSTPAARVDRKTRYPKTE